MFQELHLSRDLVNPVLHAGQDTLLLLLLLLHCLCQLFHLSLLLRLLGLQVLD